MGSQYNPLVSIVIPVYNGENYLREAVDSALAQTYENIEVIVINDGSSDGTDAVARSYGDRIRYFAKPNGGTSTALNVGIRNMKGEYFSWLSHDDLYYPDKIAVQVDELNRLQDRETVLMSDLDGINEHYEKIYKTDYMGMALQHPPRLQSPIYPIIYMRLHGCTLLIPRKAFDVVGLFDEKCLVAQDFELFYRVFLKYRYKYIPKILVTARDHSVRQGIRSKVKGSAEYSKLFTSIIETLSERDMLLLAPSVLSFYKDMEVMFKACGYAEAVEYMRGKMLPNLQVNYTDLVGARFNGHQLHLNLRKKGIDSSQLVFRKDSDDENTFLWSGAENQASLYPIIEEVENQYNIKSLFSPFPYDILTNKLFLDAELVHYHILHHPAFNFHLFPIMTRLKPTVWTLHDPWALTGRCVHPFECTRFETGCGECPDLGSLFAMSADNSALNFALKRDLIQRSTVSIVVASEWMKRMVEKSPITRGLPVHVVPFGLDHSVFKPADKKRAKRELGIDENSPTLMFRSDDGKFKGKEIIHEALRSIATSKKATLITVDAKGLLAEFADKFDVIEHGWLNDDARLAGLYQAADVFLMPSMADGFGLMAAEAMSCGTLVLTIEGTAVPGVVNAPDCGVATDRSAAAFGRELQRLLDHPAEVEQRGLKSAEYAKKNFDQDVYTERMLGIYREVIRRHRLSDEDRLVLEQLRKHMGRELVAESFKEPYSFGGIAKAKMLIQQNKELAEAAAAIDLELARVLASRRYKAGRALLWPLSALKGLLRRGR